MDIEQAKLFQCLEGLSGTWVGKGIGEFPTITTFSYREELTFTSNSSKAYLHYEQRTWRRDESGNEVASHWETGFWRLLPTQEVELLCAQSGGRVEIARGSLTMTPDGFNLDLRSSLVANDSRAEGTLRKFILGGDILRYSMYMQTTAVPALTLHVQAQLEQSR